MAMALNPLPTNVKLGDAELQKDGKKIWPEAIDELPEAGFADTLLFALSKEAVDSKAIVEPHAKATAAPVPISKATPVNFEQVSPTVTAPSHTSPEQKIVVVSKTTSNHATTAPENRNPFGNNGKTAPSSDATPQNQPRSPTPSTPKFDEPSFHASSDKNQLPVIENTSWSAVETVHQATANLPQGSEVKLEGSFTTTNLEVLATSIPETPATNKIQNPALDMVDISDSARANEQPTLPLREFVVAQENDGNRSTDQLSPSVSGIHSSQSEGREAATEQNDVEKGHTSSVQTTELAATQNQPIQRTNIENSVESLRDELVTTHIQHSKLNLNSEFNTTKTHSGNTFLQPSTPPREDSNLFSSGSPIAAKPTQTSTQTNHHNELLGSNGSPNFLESDVFAGVASRLNPSIPIPTSSATPTPSAPTLQLPEQISSQIRSAMKSETGRDIEIRLDPEELGRLRIVLSTKEGGMNVTVFSDKSDVLDLMRRHSDLLEADFSDIGYEGASFTFQQEQEDSQEADQDALELSHIEASDDMPPATQQYEIDETARLDLRL